MTASLSQMKQLILKKVYLDAGQGSRRSSYLLLTAFFLLALPPQNYKYK